MKRRFFGLRGGTPAFAVFLGLCAVAWAAELRMVIVDEAAIRRDKANYARKLATVTEGEKVTLLEEPEEEPWVRVEYKGVEGWMNSSAVTADLDTPLSTSKVAKDARATERSAARRGFSPEVEKEYRKTKPNLDAAYVFLDKIEKQKPNEDLVLKFLEQGKFIPAEGGGEK